MYEILIKNYIKKLTKEDILDFCYKENIHLNNKELDLAYIYIKKYWKEFLKKDPSNIFNELKNKLSDSTYKKMIEIYEKYKVYKKYL